MRLLLLLCSGCAAVADPRIESHGEPGERAGPLLPVDGAPRNVVLVIGDGMGLSQVSAAMIANGGRLHLDRFPVIGLSKTWSADDLVTDSAAGATAIACGIKTNNKAIGVGPDGAPCTTLLELAEAGGLATGLVATSRVTHATPAAFAAHVPHREQEHAIAADMVDSGVDLLIGGGRDRFVDRPDGRDLLEELRERGYTVTDTLEGLGDGPAAVFLEEGALDTAPARGDLLARSALTALERLSRDEDGFFLLVEGSQIDWGGHRNQLGRVVDETLDLDRAVGEVLAWAAQRGDTLVVVTADHETGGLALERGELATGALKGDFSTRQHTATLVPVFAFGPGASALAGVYENTHLFDVLSAAIGAP